MNELNDPLKWWSPGDSKTLPPPIISKSLAKSILNWNGKNSHSIGTFLSRLIFLFARSHRSHTPLDPPDRACETNDVDGSPIVCCKCENARQSDSMSFSRLLLVPASELCNGNFLKEETSPHLHILSKRFNQVTKWIGTEVVRNYLNQRAEAHDMVGLLYTRYKDTEKSNRAFYHPRSGTPTPYLFML